ncbi:MAG: hypothetical protein ACXVEF_22250 [Polyangiales bacterium]
MRAASVFAFAMIGCVSGAIDDGPESPDSTSIGQQSDAAIDGSVDAAEDAPIDAPPPFTCDPAGATSPVLGATMLLDPATAYVGDTLTVLVKSVDRFTQTSAPKQQLEATSARGVTTHETMITAGVLGAKGLVYHYEVPDLPAGDVCLLTKIDGKPELAGKITVLPRPSPTGGKGVYKVTKNHQFTCEEQVPWGNELHVAVLDENGKGVPGAIVEVKLPATTDTKNIKNATDHPVPTKLTMNDSGSWDDYFWWPSNTNGFLVIELAVQGSPSDVATEITSGWWDSDATGCRYCDPANPINVYGHWSHRIVFQLDTKVTDACIVPSDHAGQSKCGAPGHLYHDPSHTTCYRVR